MALHYNLSKLYEIAPNDDDYLLVILKFFVNDVTTEIKQTKKTIALLEYNNVQADVQKLIPYFELIGLHNAKKELKLLESWCMAKGKKSAGKELIKSIEAQVEKARKEICIDFKLKEKQH